MLESRSRQAGAVLRPSGRRDDEPAAARLSVPVPPPRRIGADDQRAVPSPGRAGRRALRHPVAPHRHRRALPGRAGDAHRLGDGARCPAWGRGSATAWGRSTRICPRTSCSARTCPTPVPRSGTAASCRPSIKASESYPVPIPIPDLNPPARPSALAGTRAAHAPRPERSPRRGRGPATPTCRRGWPASRPPAGMMREAPEVLDVRTESPRDARAIRHDRRGDSRPSAAQCLVARRLVEHGVRDGRDDRHRIEQQLGRPRRHARPSPQGRSASTGPSRRA